MLPRNKINVICTIFLCELWSWSDAEVFSAIADCEPLLNTYKLVIDDLDTYIKKEERRIFALKRNLDAFKREHALAMEDNISNYIGNPINAFTLIKRLTIDLREIEQNANLSTEFIRNVTKNKANAIFPNDEDLSGAATALTRLQDTYKLQVDELAEGKINGVPYSLPMSAGDCFELGRVLYSNADYENSIKWMLKALPKYANKEETEVYSFNLVEIMDYLIWSYSILGDIQSSNVWMKKRMHLDSKPPNLSIFGTKNAEKGVNDQPQAENTWDTVIYADWYKALCRGGYQPALEITKRLTCFYLTKHGPFLRLAPFKAEQLYINPDIFIFYDVISDKEIQHIKDLAKPRLERAKIHNFITGEVKSVQHRVSKYASLRYYDNVIGRISRRITDFTGLSMDLAEPLQAVNYGIGGHYEPHFDHERKHGFIHLRGNNTFHTSQAGKRIATVLFYMSDVPEGGATVFLYLGLSVFPVKNAALFWMNLHPSGEGDVFTLHAGCPVLLGSKWILNKWFRHDGQVFQKPCSLEYQKEVHHEQTCRPCVHKSLL